VVEGLVGVMHALGRRRVVPVSVVVSVMVMVMVMVNKGSDACSDLRTSKSTSSSSCVAVLVVLPAATSCDVRLACESVRVRQ
jgi:hypothetical protein